jgi:hypothetical protein
MRIKFDKIDGKNSYKFYHITGLKMLTQKAQEHLDRMSELEKTLIRTRVEPQPPINPFIVDDKWIYFLKNNTLVCVELKEQNGVFVLWFDNQIIEFDRTTGNCIIFSSSENFWEYFSVDCHYVNMTQKMLCAFLYKLLTKQQINRMHGRTIRSLRFFFTPNCVVGHLERAGGTALKVPENSLSLHEMICGIKNFMMARFISLFMRPPNFFLSAVQRSQSPFSVAGKYGIGLFLQSEFNRRLPAFGMISTLMKKLFVGLPETGIFNNRVAMGFLKIMFDSIIREILLTFSLNPIGFRQAIAKMNELLASYRFSNAKLVLGGFPCSITDCVEKMSDALQGREKACEKRRREEFDEYDRLEKEKRRREEAMQEFRNGIDEAKSDLKKIRQLADRLDKICNDSPRKK